jgi:hypothetical protein
MPQLDLQNALLRLYGPAGANRIRAEDVSTISFGDLDAWLADPALPEVAATGERVAGAGWIVFALTEYNPDGRAASGAVKRFLDRAPVDVRNKNLVAMAFNAPYHLDSTEISKLSAYFAVYNKTEPAIDVAFGAMFGDVTPRGHSPVNISGIFYSVSEVTQPATEQEIKLSIFGRDGGDAPNTGSVGLVAGPIVDRNGSPVPDGTLVSFSLSRGASAISGALARTVDGLAGAELQTDGEGEYEAKATVAGIESNVFAIRVSGGEPTAVTSPNAAAGGDGGDGGALVLALAIGVPSAAGVAIVGGAGLMLYRRRRRAPVAPAPVAATATEAIVEEAVPALRIDADARRVYVKGVEARPPLSNEQFRLLSYLYDRWGKVVSRDELVAHVWPEAHADGVSEEALDALVRRVRERIVQAGGERSYIVTLRGQGFRLEA